MWLGIAMLTCNLWFIGVFSLIFWIYYERIIFAEEAFLRDKFGDIYLEWTARTPIFIPFKPRWQKSDSPFLWRKVLKQEKNGFMALFVVFFLFDLLGTRIDHQEWIINKSWFPVMVMVASVAYILIKLLKRRF